MTDPEWTTRGKTIAHLIRELQSFEDQNMEVRISLDHGATSYPISLVGKYNNNYAVLSNQQFDPTPIHHQILPPNMRGSDGNDL
jgi:hypothetical protein